MEAHEGSAENHSQVCPECGMDVLLGTGGQKNLLRHIGKARCRESQEKRENKVKAQPQAELMASFFKKKESVHRPTVVPPALLQSLAPEPIHSPLPSKPNLPHTEEAPKMPSQPDKGLQSASCLSKLRHIATNLPDTVPLAAPSDPIAALTGDPKEIVATRKLEEPDEDVYEWLDKKLNNICGEYAKRNGTLASAIRRGPMGLPGLCATLQYFTNNKFASEEILEIRINNLIEEAKKIIPLESHPASTRPSPRRQDNTVLTQRMLPSPQPGTKHLPFLLDSDEDSDSPPQIIDNKHPCQGIRIDVPEGRSPFLEWPWKEQAELAMAWDIHTKNGILTLHAPTCLQLTLRVNEPCRECQLLQNNQRLCRIQDRIHRGVPETTPYKYLGMSGLIEILRQKDHQIDSLKLQCLNTNRKLDLLMTSNLDYKRFVMAVGECNVPRLNQLVRSALRKKHGINGIIQLIGRAALGTYSPRHTEQEHLMSVVLYRLGGARVAEFAHAALSMPGIATTR
ncbi:uncharacterized protein EI90DRAFT_3199739 [Cantharellus anzutake]|uniref:uncharacterized protein n=1 Tax=Cantharellus anzutake TaxID=1750568 RepID=UPI001905168B|nr:uncharacterized protein EI90DRAFT_3199739 [Cantharellus anzutake]KAF8331049.1 hypothetical protein EI90DRAFT_3199739 [Cantharellus anzutake]